MTWFWYVATDQELMLDLDSKVAGSHFGATRVRLEAAIRSELLDVLDYLYVYRSGTAGHYHVVIPLRRPMGNVERFAWEMQLRSDLYRGRSNIMRAVRGVPAPGLLIAPRPWKDFYRPPDARCDCKAKHGWRNFGACPAANVLRGEHAGDSYFGALMSRRVVLPIEFREGRVRMADFASSLDRNNGE